MMFREIVSNFNNTSGCNCDESDRTEWFENDKANDTNK